MLKKVIQPVLVGLRYCFESKNYFKFQISVATVRNLSVFRMKQKESVPIDLNDVITLVNNA